MKALAKKSDPFANFNFRVQFHHAKLGNIYCGFNFVSGIGVSSVFKEHREGGNNSTPDLILESISTHPVTMTKGMTVDESIYQLVSMMYKNENGVIAPFKNRFDVSVQVMDRQQKSVVKQYQLKDCVVEQFILGDMNSMGTEILMETVIIRFNEMDKI